MSHVRTVCEHGTQISTCRCPSPSKRTVVQRPCPFPGHVGMAPDPRLQMPQEPAQVPAGAPETPEPVSQGGSGAQSGAEGVEQLIANDRVAGAFVKLLDPEAGPIMPPRPPGPEEVYRAAINRYLRSTEFARRVDHTVQWTLASGVDKPGPLGERWLLTGVIVGMYQAGG